MVSACWNRTVLEDANSRRLVVDNSSGILGEQKTKDYYLNLATSTLNEAIRIDRDWMVNTLARGIISLMKSALSTNPAEKKTNMDSATKIFDESYKGHGGKRNMFAAMARARILFANRKYAQALEGYQEVLLHRPDMDPDPRIGIGLCYWALGYKDDAKIAWERAMEIVCLYGVTIGSVMKLNKSNITFLGPQL